MVVDRFEVLGFDDIGVDSAFGVEPSGDVAHHVFHKFRIVVGAFGDEFLVRALEQPVQFAGCLRFHQLDDFLDPDMLKDSGRDRDMGALVVRATVRDLL